MRGDTNFVWVQRNLAIIFVQFYILFRQKDSSIRNFFRRCFCTKCVVKLIATLKRMVECLTCTSAKKSRGIDKLFNLIRYCPLVGRGWKLKRSWCLYRKNNYDLGGGGNECLNAGAIQIWVQRNIARLFVNCSILRYCIFCSSKGGLVNFVERNFFQIVSAMILKCIVKIICLNTRQYKFRMSTKKSRDDISIVNCLILHPLRQKRGTRRFTE